MSDEGQIVMGRNHIQAVERQNCSGFGEEDGIVQPRCLTGKERGGCRGHTAGGWRSSHLGLSSDAKISGLPSLL